jgi:CheY-like chemotaxis protein
MHRPSAVAHVLLIDAYDEREMYAQMMRFHGFLVTTASTAHDGYALLARARPDVIVQGMKLPDASGCDVARTLKTATRTCNIPLIGLTGYSDRGFLEAARAAGCDSVLLKPCLPDALIAEIRRLLARAAPPRRRSVAKAALRRRHEAIVASGRNRRR